MSLFKTITESGVAFAPTNSEKRNVVLTNYISLVAALATLLLLVGRQFFAYVNFSVAFTLILGFALFLIPIALNRFGYFNASRLVLCWLPALYQIYASVTTHIETGEPENSTYVGLRFFLLAFSCFPFLVFDIGKKNYLFFLGLIGPVACILLYDPIMNFFGVGYHQVGLHESSYLFNNVRIGVSILIIGASSYFLKVLVERNEALNEKLIQELEEKNRLVKQQASHELHQLNEQLYANLHQLTEREFILNQSQKIAKIGSWDYKIEGNHTFWSDEMYNIFGLDKNFNPETRDVAQLLMGKDGELIVDATKRLLKVGTPYDLTVRTRTPLGYMKWVRIAAFPSIVDKKIIGASGICHDVTYYKEAQELTTASEMKYRSLFEQASDAIMVTDFAGNFTDVNASLCKMFGYSKEELLGMNFADLIEKESLEAEPIQFDKLKIGEHIFSKRSIIHKDGTIVSIEANVKSSGDNRIMAILRDVTELRKAERQLQISEALFRGAFEFSAIGMALVSLKGKWLRVNRQLCSILGYSEEQMLRMNFQDITHPDDLSADLMILKKTITGELEALQVEKRYFHKSGAIKWVDLNVALIRDDQGKPLYFVAQIQDINEKKAAEERLMFSQANLNATINNTEILIWSVNREFKLLTFNQPFFNFIRENYGGEVKIGSRILEDVMSPEARDLDQKWEQIYLRTLAGEIVTLEETLFAMDFQYSMSPIIEDTKVIGVSVFAENVTERKIRERELAEANKKIGELRLMSLRSVMNPHFVFNVLNSIQFFIARNDRLNAINYLSTFSKLMRSILTHSVDNKVKLTEEIDMLKNYIELEKTRFENKFDFILKVNPSVDLENIEIPSLLIQPYVENAIIHGLYNKMGPGTLTIHVKQDDSSVIFEIEDDGIGRKAATELRAQNFPAHKSMGIKVTEERLKLINEHNSVGFRIEDLENASGPAGTRVTVWVKI